MAKSNLPVKYDEELARRAAFYKEAEAATGAGKFLSVRAGQMSFQGSPVNGNKLDIVILDAVFENAYYEGEFDADNPASPVCYAFSHDGKDMKPHEASPKKQHAQCGQPGQPGCCPRNEFGTAERGRGKACKNIRRLAIIPVSKPFTPESVGKSEVAFFKVPVTSVTAYAVHVKQVADLLKKPPLGVVTTLGCQPDPKKQVAVTFGVAAEIKDQKLGSALMNKADSVGGLLVAPYPVFEDEPKKTGGKKKKARKYA